MPLFAKKVSIIKGDKINMISCSVKRNMKQTQGKLIYPLLPHLPYNRNIKSYICRTYNSEFTTKHERVMLYNKTNECK